MVVDMVVDMDMDTKRCVAAYCCCSPPPPSSMERRHYNLQVARLRLLLGLRVLRQGVADEVEHVLDDLLGRRDVPERELHPVLALVVVVVVFIHRSYTWARYYVVSGL